MNDLLRVVWRRRLFLMLLLGTASLADAMWIYGKAQLAQLLIEDAWHKTLVNQSAVKPWAWADTWPAGRLQVPQHNIDLFVLNGLQGNALAFGPGYIQSSSPLSSKKVSIIAGHRDTHFKFMQRLQIGDRLIFTNTEGLLSYYRITDLSVVDSSQQELEVYIGQEKLILVTCYPFNTIDIGGPLRYVATAVPDSLHHEMVELDGMASNLVAKEI